MSFHDVRFPTAISRNAQGGPEREVGLHRSKICVLELAFVCWAKTDVFAANVRPVQDGHHPWGGLSLTAGFKRVASELRTAHPLAHEVRAFVSGSAPLSPAWTRRTRRRPLRKILRPSLPVRFDACPRL